MAVLCKRCGQASPADASYCHFDGAALLGSQVHGPLNLAQAPFQEPFHFPTGEVCQNFDQLGLTCQLRWQETQDLLRNGVLEAFLGRMGRADLMRAASEAAALADVDRGVEHFLSRLPAKNLMAPRLHVEPAALQLGTLTPGQDRQFTLKLTNHGHRLIAGSISADVPWLQIEGATPESPRLVQFPHEQAIVVRVAGNKLAAAQKPLEGKVIACTDAGTCEVAVHCEVPVRPFPEGIMQGCLTPRDLAHKAKHFPDEAAVLFFNGAVKAWYAANGWTYPVEGEPASGKAAVQQFFEALGLTRPPRVILDTPSLNFQGKPGQRQLQYVELHTDEKRAIFAFARSLCPWLTIVESTAQGNRVVIAVDANIPNTSAARLDGQIEVRSNGNQRFRVRVALQIDAPTVPGPSPATPHAVVQPAAAVAPAPGKVGGCLFKACLTCGVLALLVMLIPAAALVYWLRPETLTFGPSPLKPYAAVVSPETCATLEVNLEAVGRVAGLEKESAALQAHIGILMRDLDLNTDEARPHRLFVALEPDGTPLSAWTFGSLPKFGKVTPGRFEFHADKGHALWVDRFEPGLAWSIDGKGRLLHGKKEAVLAALDREKMGKATPAYDVLARAALGVSPDALAWAAGDFSAGPAPAVALLFGGMPPITVMQFRVEITSEANNRQMVRARGSFPSPEEAVACREALRQGLPPGAIPFVPPALDFNKYVLGAATWDEAGSLLHAQVALHPTTTSAFMQVAGMSVKKAHQDTQAAIDERCRTLFEPGVEAEKKGQYAQAVSEYERVVLLFPRHAETRSNLQRARQVLAEHEQYLADLVSARDALDAGKLDTVRDTLERLKKSRFAGDGQVLALDRDLLAKGRSTQVRDILKEGEDLLASNLAGAESRFQKACKLSPDDRHAADALVAVKQLRELQGVLHQGDEQLRDLRPGDAGQTLAKGIDRFVAEAKSPVWREPAFTTQRGKLLKEGIGGCRKASDALQAAADTAQKSAERLLTQNPAAALDEYEAALARLDQARALLGDVQRFSGDKTAGVAQIKAVEAQRALAQEGKKRIGGVSLVAKGNKALQQAQAVLADARADPSVVPTGGASLVTALKFFQEAEALKEPGAAEKIQTVEKMKLRFERILHPLVLDPSKDFSREDWSFQRSQWTFKESEGKVWLHAAPGEVALLDSTARDWPVEFEMELEFAIVDAKSKFYNRLWSTHLDPLTVTFHHTNGTATSIALGKDNINKLQPLARLQLGGKQFTIENDLVANGPMRLILRAQKTDGKRTLSVLLDKRKVCTYPLPEEVQSVQLRVAPLMTLQPRFVAIYGLDAVWIGAKDTKDKTP
jgi:hypothetical protein